MVISEHGTDRIFINRIKIRLIVKHTNNQNSITV